MRRLGQLYGGILQRRLRCGIFLQQKKLRCRIYLHLTCTNSVALQNFLQPTCTNSVALQNFLQRTCTNSRHVAEIICNAICVAEYICNGHAQTVIALQTDLKFFFKKTAAVSSNSQYNLYSTIIFYKTHHKQIKQEHGYTYTFSTHFLHKRTRVLPSTAQNTVGYSVLGSGWGTRVILCRKCVEKM